MHVVNHVTFQCKDAHSPSFYANYKKSQYPSHWFMYVMELKALLLLYKQGSVFQWCT